MTSLSSVLAFATSVWQPAAPGVMDRLLDRSAFLALLQPEHGVMLLLALLVLYFSVSRNYEPLTLVPIAFGMLIGNLVPHAWMGAFDQWLHLPGWWGLSVAQVVAFVLPPLLFIGLGASFDLASILSRPKVALAGAAAQAGIFLVFVGASYAGLAPKDAAAVAVIGSASGPLALFAAGQLSPALMVPIALAAYSFALIGPLLQPLVARLLTTAGERRIKTAPGRPVSGAESIACPIAGLLISALLVPASLPMLGAFFFGNLLRATGVTCQLAKTAASALLDLCVILLGVVIGTAASAGVVLTPASAAVFGWGLAAFVLATAAGVLFLKLMNIGGADPVNPLLGAAGVCALPGTARTVETLATASDPSNRLQPFAAGAGAAGLVGSVLATGLLLGLFSGAL